MLEIAAAIFLGSVALSLVSPVLGITVALLVLYIIQLPVIVLGSEPFLWFFYALFVVFSYILMARAKDIRKSTLTLGIMLLAWFFMVTVYYKFPYQFILSPEMVVIAVASFLVARYSLKSFGSVKAPRALTGMAGVSLPFTWAAFFCLAISTPSPLQSAIVNSQQGVRTIVPAQKLNGGARVFAKTSEGLLAITMYPYRSAENSYVILLLDEDGQPKRPPLTTGSRLNEIGQTPFNPDVWYIPGLKNSAICTLNIKSWKPEKCSRIRYYHTHAISSPSGRYVATYAEQSKYIGVFDTDSLENLTFVNPLNDEGCRWIALNFIDDTSLLGFCRISYSPTRFSEHYLFEFRIDDYSVRALRKIHLPYILQIEGIETIDGKIYLLDSSLGRIFVYDPEFRRIYARKTLMPTLRYLKKIDSLNLLVAAGELGFVYILDYDLNVLKVLFCGSKIKSVNVDGYKLHMASQAGLVEVDLKEVLAAR